MGCITWVGTDHYYGRKPFGVGKRIRGVKERGNGFDSEATRTVMKGVGRGVICRVFED